MPVSWRSPLNKHVALIIALIIHKNKTDKTYNYDNVPNKDQIRTVYCDSRNILDEFVN